MAAQLPPDVEYTQRGTLWVAADDGEMQEICRKHSVYSANGIPSEIVAGNALVSLEPALAHGLTGGLLVSEDAVVSPQLAAQTMIQQAVAGGAILIRETAAAMKSGIVVLGSGDQLHAPMLVNAAGEGAPMLTPGLPVAMRKGHLAITHPRPGFLRYQVVELGYLKSAHVTTTDTVAFNVQPRRNGQLLVGSSRQFGVSSREVDDGMLARMYARATEYLPALPSLSIERTWTGFRSATPDKLPLIGPSAEDETVFLATGHEGLGITTSLATAQLLADSIAGRTPAIPIAPYSPSRILRRW
jgi:glycine/D-amino acid oxidase-like deaminating enzyme